MREKLGKLKKQRRDFTARVGRRGSYRTFKGKHIPTIVLEDICEDGVKDVLADYLWVVSRHWSRGVETGDAIKISARVKWYERGYFDEESHDLDYTLEGIKLLANYGKRWRGDQWIKAQLARA